MSFHWEHFATLSSRQAMSSDAILAAMKRCHRHLTKLTKRSVPYFWVIEGDHGGNVGIHAHALFARTGGPSTDSIRNAWKHGYTDIALYDE